MLICALRYSHKLAIKISAPRNLTKVITVYLYKSYCTTTPMLVCYLFIYLLLFVVVVCGFFVVFLFVCLL